MKIEKRQLIFFIIFGILIIGFVGGVIGEDILESSGKDKFELEKPNTWPQASLTQIRNIVDKGKLDGGWYDRKLGEMKEEQIKPFFTLLMKEIKGEEYINLWKNLKLAEAKVDMMDLFNDDKLKDIRNNFVKAVIKAETERDISISGLEGVTDIKYKEDKDGKNKQIIFKGADGKEHIIPLTNIPKGITDISFAKMEVGGQGYAVHYFNGDGKDATGVVLSSGYLKEVEGRMEVWDKVGDKDGKIGEVIIKENVKSAVFFRGTPQDVKDKNGKSHSFKMGNYVWGKKAEDITFTKVGDVIIKPSEGDIQTSDNRYAGFVSGGGVRGIVENGNIKAEIIYQNDVGLKIDGKVVGGNDNFIEITSNKDNKDNKDIEVKFPKGVTSAEIINSGGKITSGDVVVGKNNPMKIVEGVIEGVMVDRQGDASAGAGRVRQGPPPPKEDSSSGCGSGGCGDKSACGEDSSCDLPLPGVEGEEDWRSKLLDKFGASESWRNKQETKSELIDGVKQEIIKEKNVRGQRQIMTKNGGFYYCPVCNKGAGGWLHLPSGSYF